MKTFAGLLLVAIMVLARCGWAAELSPVPYRRRAAGGSQAFSLAGGPRYRARVAQS